MKLSRLELFGFKSFLHRTVFTFSDGITSVVGPNGCGKSNLVDAIVWVLGERGTKSLRVKDMGDVIFHGSNGKRPVNLAEVTLELADGNGGHSVRRRIYRDGVNEYFLDGRMVRLKDVQEFFLGTGVGINSYAIVEQGRIGQLISMKPQDRKVLVEEASGITRFEERKREALARMEEVAANLERVTDIEREVKAAFEKAEGEWERWRQYRVLADELRVVEAELLADGYKKVQRRIERIDERRRDLDGEIAARGEALAGLEDRLATKEQEFELADTVMRQLEVDLKAKEKDLEAKVLEMEHAAGEARRLEKEMVALKEESRRIDETAERTAAEIADLTETQVREEELSSREEERGRILGVEVEALRAALEGAEREVEEARTRLFVATSAIAEARNRIGEAERAARERRRREELRDEQKKRLADRLAVLDEECRLQEILARKAGEESARLAARAREALSARDAKARGLEAERRRLDELKAEKKAKEELLRRLRGEKEGESPADPGLPRLVDAIRFRGDPERGTERFFLREMEYFTIASADPAVIADLVRRTPANYVFFPAKGPFVRCGDAVEVQVREVGSVEEALNRVAAGEEGIFVAGDILVDSRGIILAEREARSADVKRFADRLRIEGEVKSLVQAVDRVSRVGASLSGELAVAESLLSEARMAAEAAEQALREREKSLVAVVTEQKTLGGALKDLEGHLDLDSGAAEEDGAALAGELERRESEAAAANDLLLARKTAREALQGRYEEGRSGWHRLSIELERRRGAIASRSAEIARKRADAGELAKAKEAKRRRLDDGAKESAALEDRQRVLGEAYDAMKIGYERETARFEEVKINLADLHMEKRALAGEREGLMREREKVRARRESLETEFAVLGEKRAVIEERLKTAYSIQDIMAVETRSTALLEGERDRLQATISDLGEVNFRAEKEYGELKERLTFLAAQKEDLLASVESLRKTISRIEGISRERFLETFETVAASFRRYAVMLFRGGSAQISLSGEPAGVELYVQPPGKKVLRMDLLSGGEKALVSLAFLLSLMDTRPSPFSLLDEIDAPLDDANLAGLLEIMREMSRNTQILFITHNRITMSSSDTVYGVTMEDDGVSKTVSVRL